MRRVSYLYSLVYIGALLVQGTKMTDDGTADATSQPTNTATKPSAEMASATPGCRWISFGMIRQVSERSEDYSHALNTPAAHSDVVQDIGSCAVFLMFAH
ncbi:hypothetical protein BDW22DRAFT_410237 [Trametopsis cervina]|nr:hypothetical protein BDW22DRAFT_410237 [Trametopsis cervina]